MHPGCYTAYRGDLQLLPGFIRSGNFWSHADCPEWWEGGVCESPIGRCIQSNIDSTMFIEFLHLPHLRSDHTILRRRCMLFLSPSVTKFDLLEHSKGSLRESCWIFWIQSPQQTGLARVTRFVHLPMQSFLHPFAYLWFTLSFVWKIPKSY